MADYPTAERVLTTWLAQQFSDARVATETPSNLADVLPCIVVTRFGGSDDAFWTYDNASMDFDCYDVDRVGARTLAHQLRTAVRRDLPGQTVAGAFIARTQSINGPIWTPYDNIDVRRFTYSAAIRLHALGVS